MAANLPRGARRPQDKPITPAVRPLLGPGLVAIEVDLPARDVVFFHSVLEASLGVGALFAEHGGKVTLAAPESRAGELRRVVIDLVDEIAGATVVSPCRPVADCGLVVDES